MAEAARTAPGSAAGIGLLPPDLLGLVAQMLIDQVSPIWDRHDLLQLSCHLAAVGNDTTTQLAAHLFAYLSPRLGQELPGGVSEASSVAELKAACKQWGLPVTGAKLALWQRLLGQVQDSEEGQDDEAPRYCLVSGATRAELTGYSHKRISQSKCKDIFDLTKSYLRDLPFVWEQKGGFAGKMFLLKDVKPIAAKHCKGDWAAFLARQQAWKQRMEDWKDEYVNKQAARKQALAAELTGRGHRAERAAEILASGDAGIYVWGCWDREPPAAACNAIEMLHFAARGPAYGHFAQAFLQDTYQPGRSTSQYKAQHQKRERAARAALPKWAAAQPSLEAIRTHPRVPASLLPRLEALWAQAQAPQAPQAQQQQQAQPPQAQHALLALLLQQQQQTQQRQAA